MTQVIEFLAVIGGVSLGLAVLVAFVIKVVAGLPAGRGKVGVRD